MKMIRSLADLEDLKTSKAIPLEMVQAIEQDFLNIYEAENENVYLLDYHLSPWQALILLEQGDNVLEVLEDPLTIEYVEKVKEGRLEFYRIAKRNDHEFQFMYSVVEIHNEQTEEILQEYVEWDERW